MNYKKHYDLLIEKAKNRLVLEGYKEKHHIVPKCMGGDNNSLNIAVLTAREHYVAHWLLHKIYPENANLIYVFNFMINGNRKKYLKLSSKEYEKIKLLISETRKKFKYTSESKLKISNSQKQRYKLNPKIHPQLGKHRTIDEKEKSSESMKKWHKTHTHKMLNKKHKNESKIKMRNSSLMYEYVYKNPNGNVINIRSMNEFCNTNKLNRKYMRYLMQGIWKQYKGWTFVDRKKLK